MTGIAMVRQLLSVLGIVLSLAGIVVCIIHVGRTLWAWCLAAGFASNLLVTGYYLAISGLMGRHMIGWSRQSIEAAYLLGGVVGLAGSVAMVAGVAGVLFDLRKATDAARLQKH